MATRNGMCRADRIPRKGAGNALVLPQDVDLRVLAAQRVAVQEQGQLRHCVQGGTSE